MNLSIYFSITFFSYFRLSNWLYQAVFFVSFTNFFKNSVVNELFATVHSVVLCNAFGWMFAINHLYVASFRYINTICNFWASVQLLAIAIQINLLSYFLVSFVLFLWKSIVFPIFLSTPYFIWLKIFFQLDAIPSAIAIISAIKAKGIDRYYLISWEGRGMKRSYYI